MLCLQTSGLRLKQRTRIWSEYGNSSCPSLFRRSIAEIVTFAVPLRVILQALNMVLCLSNEEAKWLEWNEVKATIRTSDLVDRLKENSPALQCGLCLRTQTTQLPGSILVLCEHSVSLVQLC